MFFVHINVTNALPDDCRSNRTSQLKVLQVLLMPNISGSNPDAHTATLAEDYRSFQKSFQTHAEMSQIRPPRLPFI